MDGGRRVRQPHVKVIERIALSDPHADRGTPRRRAKDRVKLVHNDQDNAPSQEELHAPNPKSGTGQVTRSVDAADVASRANRGEGLQAGPKIEAFWLAPRSRLGADSMAVAVAGSITRSTGIPAWLLAPMGARFEPVAHHWGGCTLISRCPGAAGSRPPRADNLLPDLRDPCRIVDLEVRKGACVAD